MKKTNLLLLVLVGLHFFIFLYSNARPIFWLQDEVSSYRFYWSMQEKEQLSLRTGLHLKDLEKPLISRYTVGAFRPRQVSNHFEMFSFKLGQWLGNDYFRDYSLIVLHLLNVGLFWFLIRKLVGHEILAWLAALLFLNAGASLSTLLFPFRAAKLLAVTFFLLNFVLLVSSSGRFEKSKPKVLLLFSLIFVLGVFTDENFILLSFLYWVYLAFNEGKNVFYSRRMWKYAAATSGLILGLGIFFFIYSKPYDAALGWHESYFQKLFGYYQNPMTYRDLAISFVGFVRSNFGTWDSSYVGRASYFAMFGLMFFCFYNPQKGRDLRFAIAIIGFILFKALLMPHMHVHKYIMPPQTVFPSMLFFTYYYVYVDSVLLILAFALLWQRQRFESRDLVILMICVSAISLSNVAHAQRNLYPTIKYHDLDNPERLKIVENIKFLRAVLSDNNNFPVYLSFPSGSKPMIDGRFGFDEEWPLYPSYVLTMFLPSLEKGEALTSFKNINSAPFLKAKMFYDLVSRKIIDLQPLQFSEPVIAAKEDWTQIPSFAITEDKGDYVFFVKGNAEILLQFDDKEVNLEQNYGISFQMFSVGLEKTQAKPISTSLKVRPLIADQPVEVVGPVFIKK